MYIYIYTHTHTHTHACTYMIHTYLAFSRTKEVEEKGRKEECRYPNMTNICDLYTHHIHIMYCENVLHCAMNAPKL